jgi:hypothetical protein
MPVREPCPSSECHATSTLPNIHLTPEALSTISSPVNGTAPVGIEDQADGHVSAEVKVGIVTVIISVVGILLQLDAREVLRRNSRLSRGPTSKDSQAAVAPHRVIDLNATPTAPMVSVDSLSTATDTIVDIPTLSIEMDISDAVLDLDWKTQV